MIGQTLHHYRILDKLGEGGMGEVYLAEDTNLGRKVAFKSLPPFKASDEDLRRRFEREARLVASLNHPNIVTVHSVEEADGVRFLTMELVEGKTLGRTIPADGLPLAEFLDLALPLSDAVSSAHEHGIVHRDLKPGNVMVTPEGRVKVLDFGLATLRSPGEAQASEGEEAKTATEVATVSGTIPYMSPEQLQGSTVGARSDIFSLGVLFYEMLTGSRPFDDTSSVNLIVAIVRDEPRAISERNGSIPVELERIVRRCLEKDPEERYATTRELCEDLKKARTQWESGSFTPGSAPRLFGRGDDDEKRGARARSRVLPPLIAAMTALLVFGAFSLLRSVVDPETPVPAASDAVKRRIVILPFENLGPPQEEYFAAGVTEEITSRLATVSGLGVISRNSAVQYAGTEKTTSEIGEELGVDFILEGTVRWNRTDEGASRVRVTPQLIRVVDDTHLWSERYDRVLEDIFEVQSEIAEQVIRQLDVTLFPRERQAIRQRPTDNLPAYESYLRGIDFARRLTYSAANGERSLEALGRAVELDPGFALAYAEMSQVHSMLYHFGHDRSDGRRQLAKEAVDRAFELSPRLPRAHLALGYYHYWVRRDYDAALEELDAAEEGLPGNTDLLEARAYIERRQGLWDDARRHLEQSLDLNPRDGRTARELANTLFFPRHYEEAVRYYDRAIDFAPDPLAAYQSKARAQMAAGDLAGSRTTLETMPRTDDPLSVWFWFWQEVYERKYREALAQLSSTSVETIRWTVAYVPISLLQAYAYDFLGEPSRARDAYDSARIFLEDALRQQGPDARLHNALGHAYAALDRHADALREGERAVELLPMSRDLIFGVYHRIELARILTKVGDLERALDEIELALSVPSQLSVELLKLDPRWDSLRDHPRFVKLVSDRLSRKR